MDLMIRRSRHVTSLLLLLLTSCGVPMTQELVDHTAPIPVTILALALSAHQY